MITNYILKIETLKNDFNKSHRYGANTVLISKDDKPDLYKEIRHISPVLGRIGKLERICGLRVHFDEDMYKGDIKVIHALNC